MKKIIFILVSFFPFTVSCQTYLKKYSSDIHNEIYSAIESTNGDYILSGYSDRYQSTPGGYLLKINNMGDITAEFTDTIADESYYGRIRKVSEDQFLLTQTINSYPQNQIKIWSLNQDFTLSHVITYSFTDSLKYGVDEFLVINDSNYCLLLSKRNNYKVDIALLAINLIDSTFNYYSPEIFEYRIPSGMIFDSVTQLIKVSALGFPIREDGSNKVFTFDPQLTLLSTYSNSLDISGQLQIASMNDANYLLSGSYIESVRGGDSRRLLTLLLDSDDLVIDSTFLTYGYDTVTYPGFGHGMLSTDSCIWVIGMYDITPQYFPYSIHPSWIQLSKLDFELNILKQYYYGGDGNYVTMDIIQTSDNGLLITGNYFNNNANPLLFQLDPFVLKTNSQGVVVSSSNQEITLHQAILSPNPGTQFINVKLAVQINLASLQLYDLQGHLLMTADINHDNSSIDASSLDSGTYIYKVISNNKNIGTGKWIKL